MIYRGFYLTLLFAVCFTGQISLASNVNKMPEIELKNWEYRWENPSGDKEGKPIWVDSAGKESIFSDSLTGWIKISRVNDVLLPNTSSVESSNERKVLWLKSKIPGGLSVWKRFSPVIFIPFVKGIMEIYLDGKKIYSPNEGFPQKNNSRLSKSIYTSGFGWHMINLPADFINKTIFFRIYSNQSGTGLSPPVYIGSANDITRRIILNDIDNILVGMVIIVIGIMSLIILIFFQRNRIFLGMTMFFLASGIFICVNTSFIYLIIKDEKLLLYVNAFSMFAIPSLYLFIAELINAKHKKMMRLPWGIHLSFIILSIVLLQIRGITVIDLVNPFFIVFTFTVIYTIIMFITIRKSIKWNSVSFILLAGTIVYLICTFVEIGIFYIQYNNNLWRSDLYVFHWGVLAFVFSLIAVLIYRYIDMMKEKDLVQRNMLQNQKVALESVIKEKEIQKMFLRQLIITQESERQRIAGELHDSIGQDLLIAKNKLILNTGAIDENIDDVTRNLTHSINEISKISHNMHPSELDDLGITLAIEAMVDRAADSSGIKFCFEMENIDKLIRNDDRINLFRIVQEAVNNILKHSNATEAVIRGNVEGNFLFIEIYDNGKGIAATQSDCSRPHFGIAGMKDRAELLNGELSISSLNKGTMVQVKIDLRRT